MGCGKKNGKILRLQFLCYVYYRLMMFPGEVIDDPSDLRMAGEELPFYPREKLIERQKYFQNVAKHTYLKGPFDKITSVAIPVAFAAACCYMIGRGIYNMSHGIGKKE